MGQRVQVMDGADAESAGGHYVVTAGRRHRKGVLLLGGVSEDLSNRRQVEGDHSGQGEGDNMVWHVAIMAGTARYTSFPPLALGRAPR
ncbi:hypothetical protein DAD186_01170 [Dermabacter vaginalis]|uniref:Uncharacterized protein n=1 Tax=Dermabacter vaginalis TaxID=1630135 RepID=A0A1B0ZFE3_9MICO|nr:hypothetical protein DAD186_01170 [Dermabacter vaginalis]